MGLVAVLAVASSARATTAVVLTETEQALASTAVVVAHVTEQHVARHPQLGRAETLTTVQIERVLYGDAPDQVVVHQLGGELDGVLLQVAGDAHLQLGDRDVLYLRQVDGGWYLTAMEQSAFTLVPSLDGDALVRQLSSELLQRSPEGVLVPWDGDDASAPTLTDLSALLASLPAKEAK